MNSSEKEYGDKIPQVNEFIENEFIAINDEISKLSEEKNNQWQPLDKLFLEVLKENLI